MYIAHFRLLRIYFKALTNVSFPCTDSSGKVRVWAWNNVQHTLKFECPALGGEVEDVAWCGESKRILAVGAGQSKAKVCSFIVNRRNPSNVSLLLIILQTLPMSSHFLHRSNFSFFPLNWTCLLTKLCII